MATEASRLQIKRQENEKAMRELQQEAALMRMYKHRHIVLFYGMVRLGRVPSLTSSLSVGDGDGHGDDRHGAHQRWLDDVVPQGASGGVLRTFWLG